MVDKKSSTQSGNIPKKPPRRPARDYSSLPQKPITLKQRGTRKTIKATGEIDTKPGRAKKQKKKAMPKKALPPAKKQLPEQWLPQGISEEARHYALNEAGRRGITIAEWIEQLIIEHRQSATAGSSRPQEDSVAPQAREDITDALHAIEHRLDQIEERRGFWSRFWDQVMKQAERRDEG
jgi:hypothetical protein